MKQLLFGIAMAITTTSFSQVIVNKVDVNDAAKTIEVWAFVKHFTVEECYFMNYGQEKFRPNYYDHKTQMISDKDRNKFKKGEWLKLTNYLESQGWEQKSERKATIGDLEGRVTTFIKS